MSTTNSENSEASADHVGPQALDAAAAQPPKKVRPRTEKPVKAKKASSPETKTDLVLKKLRAGKGASIEQLVEATGWQAHSVRGFLSATVRKKLDLPLVSDVGKDGIRRYRISVS